MPGASGGPPGAESARRAVEAVWRIESARIVGALARYTGDFELAEDVAQEAVAEALVTWSRDGAPANPVGWLLATARRRAIDSFRRRSALDERYTMLAGQLAEGEASSGAVAPRDRPDDLPWDPDRVGDDVLALMFVACHPVLSPEARVALTLRAVGGLSSEEIARAFLVPVPTVQARITRAKKTIAAAGVPFGLPPSEQRRERLGGVLSVLYVIFTEGSTATAGDRLLRPDLAYEAIRLARVLAALLPDEPEVCGLLALFELTAARFPARTGPDGEAVLLEDQDRRLWDRSAIRRGLAAIAWLRHRSSSSTGRSPSRWRMGHSRRFPLWTSWPPPNACRGRTCSRACAASCSSGSAGSPRHGPSWSSPPGCAATSASGRYCYARRLRWRDRRLECR
jgi:RNA polymerase sigma factor (sigma-70 family)